MGVSIGRMISLAALAAFASTGLLQAAEHATFHMPFAAQWGQTVLQPGDYKMTLPEPGTGDTKFLVKGADKAVFELSLVATAQSVSSSSYFKLKEINGRYFVTEFSSGPSGKTFTFSVPKSRHVQQMAKSEDEKILVAAK